MKWLKSVESRSDTSTEKKPGIGKESTIIFAWFCNSSLFAWDMIFHCNRPQNAVVVLTFACRYSSPSSSWSGACAIQRIFTLKVVTSVTRECCTTIHILPICRQCNLAVVRCAEVITNNSWRSNLDILYVNCIHN